MSRRLALSALSLFVAGCASSEFKALNFPDPVVLQDAPPDGAVVYLIRAPHDSATLPVYVNDRLVVVLPPASYSLVLLAPGTYDIASSIRGTSSNAPASSLTLRNGERRFLYSSARTGTSLDLSLLPGGIPLALPRTGAVGARTWRECSEFDAQGLMSIAKVILPEAGAI